jgi:hypothetical protein
VDDDLVDESSVQALGARRSPRNLDVLPFGGITGCRERLFKLGEEGGLWVIGRVLRMMGEDEYGSVQRPP